MMENEVKENKNELLALDRAFIISLFYGFCTTLPEDLRSILACNESDALQFVMVLRPRLTSFLHRHVSSLRHPAVSRAARQYFNELRAFSRGETPEPCGDTSSAVSPTKGLNDRRGSQYERGSSEHFCSQRPFNPRLIKLEQLTQGRWNLLGACYDVLLQNSQPRCRVISAIARNKLLNDIICRYWTRMTVPPNASNIDSSNDTNCNLMTMQGASEHSSLMFLTHMTPQQYVYLHLRIAGILLPPGAFEENLLDSIILDLRTDSKLFEKSTGFSFCKALQMSLRKGNEDLSMDDVELQSQRQKGLRNVTRADILNAAESAAPNCSLDMNSVAKSLENLPSITFGQFWESMLELSDNWTSSAHPMEYAIFLMELYCEVFAHEWDDEETAVLRSFREVSADFPGFQQEDLFSLVDCDDVAMLQGLSNLSWSITDGHLLGFSYRSSKTSSKLQPRDHSSNLSEKSAAKSTAVAPGCSYSLSRGSRSSWSGSLSAVGVEQIGGNKRRHKADGKRLLGHSISDTESEGEDHSAYGDGEEYEEKEGDVGEVGRYRKNRYGVKAKGDRSMLDKRRRPHQRGHYAVGEGEEESAEKDARGRRRHWKHHGGEEENKRKGKNKEFERVQQRRLQGKSGDIQKRQSHKGTESENEIISLWSHTDSSTSADSFYEDSSRIQYPAKYHKHDRYHSASAKKRRHADSTYYAGKDKNIDMYNRNKDHYDQYSEEYSFGSDDSSAYQMNGSQLASTGLPRLSRLSQQGQEQQLLNKLERKRHSGNVQMKTDKGRYSSQVTFTKEELKAKRQLVIDTLCSKGITIDPELLTEEDIIDISENSIDENMLRRLMARAECSKENLKESDFLHILLGDQAVRPAGADAFTMESVLAALRKQRRRGPPETAYTRHLREQREQREREEEEQFRKELAAQRERRHEERRIRQQRRQLLLAKSRICDEALRSGNLELPTLLPSDNANKPQPRRLLSKVQNLVCSDIESDSITELFLPILRLPPKRLVRENYLLRHKHIPDLENPLIPTAGSRFFVDAISNDMPMLHEHSQEKLDFFYQKLSTYQPVKGRARLAPSIAIQGGTYHQLPIVKLEEWKAQRAKQQSSNVQSLQPVEERRFAPVKLFSLTTKTSLAEALRENLQRYIDDKAYLAALYESYSK